MPCDNAHLPQGALSKRCLEAWVHNYTQLSHCAALRGIKYISDTWPFLSRLGGQRHFAFHAGACEGTD